MKITRSVNGLLMVIIFAVLMSCGGFQESDVDVAPGLVFINSADQETGIPIRTYFWPGAHAHSGYFNTPLYTFGTDFYFVSDGLDGANLYLYTAGRSTKVSSFKDLNIYTSANVFGLSLVSSSDFLFYTDGSAIYRVRKGEFAPVSTIFVAGKDESLWAPLHVTQDGQYLSVTLTKSTEPKINYICRINISDETRVCLKSPLAGTDKPYIDHAQIHPYNPNLVMFAHDDSWIRDRVWLWNINKEQASARWIQPELTEVGHEFWDGSDDGLVYAVQYGQPAYNIPSGLIKLDSNGVATLIGSNTKYYLSHASISPNRHYFAADTYRPDSMGRYWLVLYDIGRNEYTKITPVPSSQHPAHGHPSWSPTGDRIMFTAMHGEYLSVKEVLLSDVLASRR